MPPYIQKNDKIIALFEIKFPYLDLTNQIYRINDLSESGIKINHSCNNIY